MLDWVVGWFWGMRGRGRESWIVLWAGFRAGGAGGTRAGLGCGLNLGQEGRREGELGRVAGWL